MANRVRGEASFDRAGETLTLCFDAEAFLEIEDRIGKSVFDLFDGKSNVRLGTMAQVLSVGLMRSHGEVTRGDAADMLLSEPAAQEALILALERAMPSAQASSGGNGRKPKAAKRGTGTKS